MIKLIINSLLVLVLCSCEPTALEKEIARLEKEGAKLKKEGELKTDSIMNDLIKLGYSYDKAMMETHGSPFHRDDCETYKKWKKGLDGN